MPDGALISWEEAVRWYRQLPDNRQAVLDNFFDLPVLPAARRFSESEEFREMLRILKPGKGRRVLDLGAGHGVTSYAMARNGWRVTALEPDPSEEVGYGAIAAWRAETGLPVEIVTDPRPPFPLAEASMDAVIARQVLHHVPDLGACLEEVFRVLKPGGLVLTTRDHVVDDETQLREFLANHPLQRLYGGENAFPLATYLEGFCRAGFEVREVWGPAESILNFFPGLESARRQMLARSPEAGKGIARLASRLPGVQRQIARRISWNDRMAGRIYSILARKPLVPQPGREAALSRWLPPASHR